jgi:predicted nucleic acid-binding protein
MSIPRMYLDANPIIELAKWAKKSHDTTRETDLRTMEQLLKAANNRVIDMFTSTISMVECVAVDNDWGPDVQEFFNGVLTSGRLLSLVQDTIFVTERARDFRWKHNIKFGGMDAIHVASAIEAKCTEFITWDLGINKGPTKIEFLASHGISCITPSQTKLLPTIYEPNPPRLFSDH